MQLNRLTLTLALTVALIGGLAGCAGSDGQDASPCSVERDDAAGTTTISCPGSDPITINDGADGEAGQTGEDGQDGEPCTAERDDEAGTITVNCPGSDPVVISDGEDGEDGQSGESCSVERDDEAGTTTISCPDSDPVVINDGEDGEDGDGCTVADNDDGTLTISCEDGTEATFRVNNPPVIEEVEIEPESPGVGQALSCAVDVTDQDGDEITLTYRWLRGGVETEYTEAQVPAGVTQEDEVWSCAATASDGAEVSSDEVTIVLVTSIFWANVSANVFTASVDGQDPQELGEVSFTVATGAGFLFNDTEGGAIVRTNLDGSNPVTINGAAGNVFGMDVDEVNEKLYWSDFNGNSVLRSDLDGSNVETIITGITSPSGLSIDETNGKIYVITYNSTTLFRANLDGTGRETIIGGLPGQGVQVVAEPQSGKIYYSIRGNDIFVADLDGSNASVFIGGQGVVQGMDLSVALGRICWAAPVAGMIRCADLEDGDDITEFPSNGNTWHVAIAD